MHRFNEASQASYIATCHSVIYQPTALVRSDDCLSQFYNDLPFKLAGGNAIGLFITDAKQCGGILATWESNCASN